MRQFRSLFLLFILVWITPVSAQVYFTRNAGGEESNPTPGYWNHVAIAAGVDVDGDEIIAEYQRDTNGVIYVKKSVFFARYPIIETVFVPVQYNRTMREKEYGIYPFARRKHNCCTFVSKYILGKYVFKPDNLHQILIAKYKKETKK